MENFMFHNPCKVIFGKGAIKKIGPAIKESGHKKILLLAGQGSIRKNGVYQQVTESLQSSGIKWSEFWGVQPNPILPKVYEAIKAARKEKVGAILAIGGGSVIDSAKATAAGFYLSDIWEVFEGLRKVEKALPLFTVLTLSATASEMNQWAVLTKPDEKKKWAIGAEILIPKVTVIDPSVQMSLPWSQTVNGAIDALSHLMENYFVGTDEMVSMRICESLMITIMEMTDRLQANPRDDNARANLVWAATMAHNGVSAIALKGGDWSAHRIEHGISALHPEIAHGTGLGIVFPAWIQYLKRYNRKTFHRWAREVWSARNIDYAVEKLKTKYSKWGAPVSLEEVGISEKEIPAMAENTMGMGKLGVVKKLSRKDVEAILRLAL